MLMLAYMLNIPCLVLAFGYYKPRFSYLKTGTGDIILTICTYEHEGGFLCFFVCNLCHHHET